jgi:hypothetical protein
MDTHRPEIDMNKYRQMTQADTNTQPAVVEDPPARFCARACRDNYREERMNGLELPRCSLDGKEVSYKFMCAQLNLCANCKSKLEM